MNSNFDSIHTEHKKCGCVISSNLDIIENLISESIIILCENHYKKCKNKKEYSFNKNKSYYTLNSFSNNSISKKNIKKSSHLDKLNKTNSKDSNKSKILLFGKYKYKTFNYVYNNDKLYCYNLSFWNDNIYNKNDNIYEFINFIKNSILV